MGIKINIAFPAVLLASALGAASGLFIKGLPYSSLGMTGFRMGIPFLFFLPLMIKRGLFLGPKQNRKQVLLGSLINALRMFLYVLAYKLTSIGNAVVLLYLWPLFALILDSVIQKKKLKSSEIILILIAMTGVIFLNLHRDLSLKGDDLLGGLIMILSAFIFSITTLIFKEALKDHKETEVLYFQNALGALIFIPFLCAELPAHSLTDFGVGVFYAFMVGIIGFGCFFVGLKRMPLFQYSALTYMEVFFGVLYGVILLNEVLLWNMILGSILILTASFLSRLGSLMPKKTEDEEPSPAES